MATTETQIPKVGPRDRAALPVVSFSYQGIANRRRLALSSIGRHNSRGLRPHHQFLQAETRGSLSIRYEWGHRKKVRPYMWPTQVRVLSVRDTGRFVLGREGSPSQVANCPQFDDIFHRSELLAEDFTAAAKDEFLRYVGRCNRPQFEMDEIALGVRYLKTW